MPIGNKHRKRSSRRDTTIWLERFPGICLMLILFYVAAKVITPLLFRQ